MRTETIDSIIRDLDGSRHNGFILHDIANNVVLGIYHFIDDPNPALQKKNGRTWTFYFIKDDMGAFVAAVYVMPNDLHWVVLPEERNRGHLIQPLKDYILPYIYNANGGNPVRITIASKGDSDLWSASEKIALKVGFSKSGETEDGTEYLYQPALTK